MFRYATLLVLTLCLGQPVLMAQSTPVPKTYTYLFYHKLSPGLTIQDALPVEREWRAINQAAVTEGNLIGWYMLAKQMTSNPNGSEYDYVSVIVSRDISLKGASPAAMAKLYGDSAQARMASLTKRDRATAPVIRSEIWETVDAVISPAFTPAQTPMVVFEFLKLRTPLSAWRQLVAPMKALKAGQLQQNVIMGWSFSSLVVPNGSEKGYSLAVAHAVPNMSIFATADQSGSAASRSEAGQFRIQFNEVVDVVRQETFRIMEFTTR